MTTTPAVTTNGQVHHEPEWGYVGEFFLNRDEDQLGTYYITNDEVPAGARNAHNGAPASVTLGTVVVFIGVDEGNHHEVHVDAYDCGGELGNLGAIKQAIAELERVRDKLEQFASLS